jgi:Flp pilus assembly protein TadG
MPTLKRLLRDEGGTSIIEFAIVAPAFLAIVIAVLQIAIVYLAQGGLETGAEGAARLLMTGQAQHGGMSATQFKTAACSSLPPYLKCNNLMVDVTTASSYSGATLGAPTITYDKDGNVTNKFSYTPGTQGSIVVVRLMYLWPVAPAPFGFNLATQPGNKRLLTATSVLKSEFY